MRRSPDVRRPGGPVVNLALLIGAGWIAASLAVALCFAAVGGSRYSEPPDPDPDREGLEIDELAAAACALEDVYGDQAYRSAKPGDRRSQAILERRVVRAPDDRGPRAPGLR